MKINDISLIFHRKKLNEMSIPIICEKKKKKKKKKKEQILF